MKKYIGAGFVAFGLLVSVGFTTPTQAAGLTEVQIQAIVSLVSSFGADAATVKNVEASLRGQSTTPTTGTSSCIDLNNTLIIGSTDATTNGEVLKLQKFLGVSPTGYYGSLTADAVVRWQKAHGMDYVTTKSGLGPTTRAKMKCAVASGSAIQKIQWRIEPANPSATESYKKDEQAIFVDVIRADNSIQGYSVGKAYGCAISNNLPAMPGKKVLGFLNCYYALSGATFTSYEANRKFIVERGDESAMDGSVIKTVLLEI